MTTVTAVIEGASDEGITRALLHHCGLELGVLLGRKGKGHIRKNIESYNRASQTSPWFILVDQDNPDECPAATRNSWLPTTEPLLVFRIAVVEVESWMLADRDQMAEFLGVSRSTLPGKPDEVPDPKQLVVNLARKSRRREIREGLAPRPGSGATVGSTYVSEIREFGLNRWRPAVAAECSPSLASCIHRLQELKSSSSR